MIEIRQTDEYESWFDGLRDSEARSASSPGSGYRNHIKQQGEVLVVLLAAALGDVARAKGMTEVVRA